MKTSFDYARSEDAAAQKQIQALLVEVYESRKFPIVQFLCFYGGKLNFILKNL